MKVSLIIVVRNEKDFIEKSLNSLLNQSYDKIEEILVIDGMSEDGTRDIITHYMKKNKKIKLINNPKKILATGWNIGIKLAKGDVICRIDAHSEIEKDYIKKGIETLLRYENENVIAVGGILENKNLKKGLIADSILTLFSSKFGTGSSFRTGVSKIKFTDTAVFALYLKKVFFEVGFFNESLKRNQDIELHKKFLRKGYKFITNPNMKIIYYTRNSIKKLLQKAFSDGYWLSFSGGSLRHFIPMFFVMYLFSLIFFHNFIFIIPLLIYLILDVFFSIRDGKNLYSKLFLIFLFPVFHISYGIGTIKGFFDRFKNNFSI